MPTVADRHSRGRDIDDAEQTIAPLCDDPQWLREQFEAIIAAEWPPRPPRVHVAVAAAPGAGRPPAGSTAESAALARRARGPGTDGWARQRAPPAAPPGGATTA